MTAVEGGAAVDGPNMAEIIANAEQRGREDNADHGQCYVYGSKALEARLAEAWEQGYAQGGRDEHLGVWTFLAPNPYRRAASEAEERQP